jgi:hypothetical protein
MDTNVRGYYSSAIAFAGHTEAQLPQLKHLDASISRFPSFSLIAPAGHSLSQEPQLMHWSEIL